MPHVKGWTKPFIDLHIKTEARQEVYLAAFLLCWLCKFILPGKKVDLIHPSTFKVASLMATGHHFCLVVPVLVNIYYNLRDISIALDFSTCAHVLPIHYVYVWLASRFATYISSKSSITPIIIAYASERMGCALEAATMLDLFINSQH